MKISIRISIVSLFVSLLLLVGGAVISVDYYMQRQAIVLHVNDLMQVHSELIQQRFTNFLQPMYEALNLGARLIQHRSVTPGQTTAFFDFLTDFLEENPDFFGAGWGEQQNGSFYYVEHRLPDTYISNSVVKTAAGLREISGPVNVVGVSLAKPLVRPTSFELTQRPWYKKAIKYREPVVIEPYLSYSLTASSEVLVVSFAYPIYLENGALRGIFIIDSKLQLFSDFISTLHVTPNAHTFVFDMQGNVLAGDIGNAVVKELPKVTDIAIPWVRASFAEYQKSKKALFFYSFMGKDYLAFYQDMPKISYIPCGVAIVLPVSDIAQPLIDNLILTVLLTIGILLGGIILISGISKAVAQPVIELANEADAIKNLDFSRALSSDSYVKEIFGMQHAFNIMKNSFKSFMRYVPIALVKKMMASGDIAHVGGENKVITFLFSDICRFTTMSEKMPPAELMSYLSEYFDVMTKIILQYEGVLDKYIGDGIMALWGTPQDDAQHALHACQCAVAMSEALTKLNEKWKAQGKPQLTLRIGINTGEAVVGNVGSEDRLNYTAIGDSVNIASRLQELNKLYGTVIIVSRATYQLVKEHFALRLLDHIAVRGKTNDLYVYEILLSDAPLKHQLPAYETEFLQAFTAYTAGNWQEAIVAFERLKLDYPLDQIADIYLERCRNFVQHPPRDWQGIWRMQ